MCKGLKNTSTCAAASSGLRENWSWFPQVLLRNKLILCGTDRKKGEAARGFIYFLFLDDITPSSEVIYYGLCWTVADPARGGQSTLVVVK